MGFVSAGAAILDVIPRKRRGYNHNALVTSGCGGRFDLLPGLRRRWPGGVLLCRFLRARRGCVLVVGMELCTLALGERGDLVERGSSMCTHVFPTLRGEFADVAEVLLVVVVELLCEPYVGAEDHEGIGQARHVFLVATAAVSRAAGSAVAAEQDVHGGAVLDDFVEGSIALRCGVRATVWTLCYGASSTGAKSCDRCGCRGAHAGPRGAGRDEPKGGDILRKGDD